MQNLAGSDYAAAIRIELRIASIPLKRHLIAPRSEVTTTLYGKLGKFTFHRAWYYWVVKGSVPLAVAQAIYATKTGRTDVRVAGNAGCPPPNEWAFPDISKMPKDELARIQHVTYGELAAMCDRGEITAPRFVTSYHIDSQHGLNLFVEMLRKHRLV